jgi:hypothetical protein
MAERTYIPGSPACGQWETLLADALDGHLEPADEATFTEHKATCQACAGLYEQARKGREWLEFLSPEPDAPEGLLEKILARTGPGQATASEWSLGGGPLPAPAGSTAIPGFMPPVWQQPGFIARMRAAAQPRLLMTAAMAFFSIAVTLNLAGVRLTSLRAADFRPTTLRSHMERQLTVASVPIVRYYDHLRFVYEVESRVRELRGQNDDDGEQQHMRAKPVNPGQSRQNPERRDGGYSPDPQQPPANSVMGPSMGPDYGPPGEMIETSLTFDGRRVQSRGSAMQAWNGRRSTRSTSWTA